MKRRAVIPWLERDKGKITMRTLTEKDTPFLRQTLEWWATQFPFPLDHTQLDAWAQQYPNEIINKGLSPTAGWYKRLIKRQQSEPIKPEEKKRELRLQWLPCSRRSSESGVAGRAAQSQRPDCFATLEDARLAEEKYFLEKGYHNEIVECLAPCGAFHVRHVYSAQKKSPTGDAIRQGAEGGEKVLQ
jgi:hypothetical protein